MENMQNFVKDYLRLLHLSCEPPTLTFLYRIIQAHIVVFPFENISKIAYLSRVDKTAVFMPTIGSYLKYHEYYGFGGTCFTLNWYLKCLLDALGYDCYAVMLSRQHMGIIVYLSELGGKVYVDCGAAAPFFEPVFLEKSGIYATQFGVEKVVIRHRISETVHRFERYRNGVLIGEPWYFDREQAQSLQNFLPIIQKSFEPNRLFMSSLWCHLYGPDLSYCLSLKNNEFQICYKDGRIVKQTLTHYEEIEQVAKAAFGLEPSFVRIAVSCIQKNGSNIFAKI